MCADLTEPNLTAAVSVILSDFAISGTHLPSCAEPFIENLALPCHSIAERKLDSQRLQVGECVGQSLWWSARRWDECC